MLSLLVFILIIVGFIALANYADKVGQEEREKFDSLLDSALKYPVSSKVLDNLILVWKEKRPSHSNLEYYFKNKYIERSFRVCEINFSNLHTWDLLEIIIKKISPFKMIPLYKNNFKEVTSRLENHLIESFNEALYNKELWEKMKKFLDSLIGCNIMTSRPIKSFYEIALKNLEDNPTQSKAKQLVLETGRLYFGWGLLGIVSAKNEIAIQNDINARLNR